jgi:hypothetical protein
MTIKLEIDTNQLVKSLDDFTSSIEELTQPEVLDQISRAVFSITGERFMIDVDNYARMNKKAMHHVYEWGKVGDKTARLFVLERSAILEGTLIISANFLQSRMPVPINPELLIPGKTGKFVSKQSIFANKAEVMEAGTPVSFMAKKVIAMTGTDGVVFVAPGTKINILHPGGLQTKNSFSKYLLEWYTKNGNVILDSSGLYERIANDVALVLSSNNSGVAQIRQAVTAIADQIDTGVIIK